jgi:MoaA/NifB/PqqE/SkfB family radical SAM enzyme
MSVKKGFWSQVDHEGRLVLAPEAATQYGLTPGVRLYVEPNGQGLRLHRPVEQLAKVYLEPSSRCNLTCRTCIRNVWDEPLGLMSEATFDRIIEDLQKLSPRPTVFFGGLGEPLTHPHLVEMAARVKALGARVELITNGTILTERVSRRLIEAELDLLWVSLDGARPESYADVRLGASLPEVLANVKRFRQLCYPAHYPTPEIGIVFVAMQRNIGDLPEIMRLAKQLGASRLLVSNVLPYTKEMRPEILYAQVTNNITYLPSPMAPHVSVPKMNTNGALTETLAQAVGKGWNVTFAGNNLGAVNDTCPFIEQGSISIGWDGSVSPCLPLLHNHVTFLHDWLRSVHRYVIGNVTEQSLSELWRLPEYVTFRQKVHEFDFSPCTFCGGCDLSIDNNEDCFGNPFPTCGGCLWAQGVVQCP